MLKTFNPLSMISLKKNSLKTKTNRNSRIVKNIGQCMKDLGIEGKVTYLNENYKKVPAFEVFLKSCDERQIRSEMLHLSGRLSTDEYMHPLVDYSIIFNNSLGIRSLDNYCELIFNNIKEMTTIKSIKKRKNFFLRIADPYIDIYSWIFKRKICQRNALNREYYRHERLMKCSEELCRKYDLKHLESAEIFARNQINKKKGMTPFLQMIIFLVPFIGIAMYVFLQTKFFTVFDEKILAFISGSIIFMKFKDESFKLFENYNMASISFEETDLSIIQEAIKQKRLYIEESKNNQTT